MRSEKGMDSFRFAESRYQHAVPQEKHRIFDAQQKDASTIEVLGHHYSMLDAEEAYIWIDKLINKSRLLPVSRPCHLI